MLDPLLVRLATIASLWLTYTPQKLCLWRVKHEYATCEFDQTRPSSRAAAQRVRGAAGLARLDLFSSNLIKYCITIRRMWSDCFYLNWLYVNVIIKIMMLKSPHPFHWLERMCGYRTGCGVNDLAHTQKLFKKFQWRCKDVKQGWNGTIYVQRVNQTMFSYCIVTWLEFYQL